MGLVNPVAAVVEKTGTSGDMLPTHPQLYNQAPWGHAGREWELIQVLVT